MKKTFWYVAKDKYPNTPLSGARAKTKREAKSFLPIYEKRGWTGGLVKITTDVKPMSKKEKENLRKTSELLNKMVETMFKEGW